MRVLVYSLMAGMSAGLIVTCIVLAFIKARDAEAVDAAGCLLLLAVAVWLMSYASKKLEVE